MRIKRIVTILLIGLIVLLAIKYLFSSNYKTTIIIKNHTNQSIENLTFISNDSEDKFNIAIIEPDSEISFKYDIGGFNENAVNLKHKSDAGESRIYNVIGYVTKIYSKIIIHIITIDQYEKLDITVETIN